MNSVSVEAGQDGLRVCVIISSFRPTIGGAERATERLCAELQKRGMKVLVLTRLHPGLQASARVWGVPVRRLGHASTTKLGALTFALHALWLLSTELRNYRILHVQNPDTPLLLGLIAKLTLRRKLLVTMHGTPDHLFSRTRLDRRLRLLLMGRIADVVGVLSPIMADAAAEAGVPRKRLRTLPNGVDVSFFAPPTKEERRQARSRIAARDAQMLYLFVGRLVSLKRVDLLLRAWSSLAGEERGTLLIVGDGPDMNALQVLAEDLGSTNVRFEGGIDDVRPLLHAADVFVLPSHEEGLSCAVLEAMATGLPVLVADLPGNRAVVRHGENGLTFAPQDRQALARGLVALGSPRLRRELGHRAASTIRAEFSLGSVADLHFDLYRELSEA